LRELRRQGNRDLRRAHLPRRFDSGIGLRCFATKRNFQLYVAHSKASIGFGQAGDSNGGCPMAPFR
jgi:hypothetical protein